MAARHANGKFIHRCYVDVDLCIVAEVGLQRYTGSFNASAIAIEYMDALVEGYFRFSYDGYSVQTGP